MKKQFICLLAVMALYSCAPNLSEISAELKQSMQEQFDSNEQFSGYRINVEKVSLFNTGYNSYKAYVDIEYLDGIKQTIDAEVHITTGLDGYTWGYEFPIGTFLFLLKHWNELESY